MPIIRPSGTNLPLPQKSSPAQKAPATTALPTQSAVQSPATRPASQVQTTVPLAALFKTLGLPNDKLSATILSFAKFFSLPLDPAMLASVRQQAKQASAPQTPTPQTPAPTTTASALTQTMQAADSREAVVLAALAAADKGVKLSEKALAEYVDAIDPDSGGEHGGGQDRGDKKEQQGRDQPDTEQSPLLDTLNKLPSKNGGRRWLVFPFAFSEGDVEFRASLRLLLDETSAGKMCLDIVRGGQSGAEPGSPALPTAASENTQRWLFVVDSALEQVQVYTKPERAAMEQQNLAGEIARFLEVPPERVSVRGSDFPFAPDCRADEFLPVDEAV